MEFNVISSSLGKFKDFLNSNLKILVDVQSLHEIDVCACVSKALYTSC